MPTQIKNFDELQELLECTASIVVVRTATNDLFLLMVSEDGDIGYQGFPQADDEEGTRIDPNTGWVESWPDIYWPLTYVGASDPDEHLAIDESDPKVTLAAVKHPKALADGNPERRTDWFEVSNREQFLIGVPLEIVGVSTGYRLAIEHAQAALDRPHTTVSRDLLTAECNEVAEQLVKIAEEDGNALSLGAALRAMILEAAFTSATLTTSGDES